MTEAAEGSRHYQVVVTVGTDHHRFDRLVEWVARWAASRPEVAVLVQRGETPAPDGVDSVPMLGYDDLVATMAGADAVVAQGGPAAIMDARSVGRRPIVVPRRGTLGEHVDDHQVTFATWMAGRDLISLAASEDELGDLLDRALVDPGSFAVTVDGGPVAETVACFARLVDPLIDRRRS